MNIPRQLLSVNTSDVVSTSAPQTTCRLLIRMSRRLSTVNAPSVTCAVTSAIRSAAGRVSSRGVRAGGTRRTSMLRSR